MLGHQHSQMSSAHVEHFGRSLLVPVIVYQGFDQYGPLELLALFAQ